MKSHLHQNRQYRPLEQIQRQATQIQSICQSFCLKNRRQKRNFNSIGNAISVVLRIISLVHLMTRLAMQNASSLEKDYENWKETQRTE